MIKIKFANQSVPKKQFSSIKCYKDYLFCTTGLTIYIYDIASDPNPFQLPVNILSIESFLTHNKQNDAQSKGKPIHMKSSTNTPNISGSVGGDLPSLGSFGSLDSKGSYGSLSNLASYHASKSRNDSITRIEVNKDGSFIAVSLYPSFQIYVFKVVLQPFKQIKFFCNISDHESRITDMKFDGLKDLFSGDDMGNLFQTTLKTGVNQILQKKGKTLKVFQMEPVVQIYCDVPSSSSGSNASINSSNSQTASLNEIDELSEENKHLLVSNTKKTMIIDRKEQKFRPVGKKERDGNNGACFQIWKDKKKYIFAARAGRRIWMSDVESGTVKSTLKFPAMDSNPNLKFDFLLPFGGDRFLISWCLEMLVVIDMKKVKVLHVYTEFFPILHVSINGIYCSILHGREGEISVLEFIPPKVEPKKVEVVQKEVKNPTENEIKKEIKNENKLETKNESKNDQNIEINQNNNKKANSKLSIQNNLIHEATHEDELTKSSIQMTISPPEQSMPKKIKPIVSDINNPDWKISASLPIQTIGRTSSKDSIGIESSSFTDHWNEVLVAESPASVSRIKSKAKRKRKVDLQNSPVLSLSSQGSNQNDFITGTMSSSSDNLIAKPKRKKVLKSKILTSNLSASVDSINFNSDTVSTPDSSASQSQKDLSQYSAESDDLLITGNFDDKKDLEINIENQSNNNQEVSTLNNLEDIKINIEVDNVDNNKINHESLKISEETLKVAIDPNNTIEKSKIDLNEDLNKKVNENIDSINKIENTIVQQSQDKLQSEIFRNDTNIIVDQVLKSDDSISSVKSLETTSDSPSNSIVEEAHTDKTEQNLPSKKENIFELITNDDQLFKTLISTIPVFFQEGKPSIHTKLNEKDFGILEKWINDLLKLIKEDRMEMYDSIPDYTKSLISCNVCIWFKQKYLSNPNFNEAKLVPQLCFYIDTEEFYIVLHHVGYMKGIEELLHFQDEFKIFSQEIQSIQKLMNVDMMKTFHELVNYSITRPSLVYRFLPKIFDLDFEVAIDISVASYPVILFSDVKEMLQGKHKDEYIKYLIRLHDTKVDCHSDRQFMHQFVEHLIYSMDSTQNLEKEEEYSILLSSIIRDLAKNELNIEPKFLEMLLAKYQIDNHLLEFYSSFGQKDILSLYIQSNNFDLITTYMESNPTIDNWTLLMRLVHDSQDPKVKKNLSSSFIIDLMCRCLNSSQILQILSENIELLQNDYEPETYRKICQLAEYEKKQSQLNHDILETVDSYMWTQKDIPVNSHTQAILDYLPKQFRNSDYSVLDYMKYGIGIIQQDSTILNVKSAFEYSNIQNYTEDCATPWGIVVDSKNVRCPGCNLKIISTQQSKQSVVFNCGHVYHQECCHHNNYVCGVCLEKNFSGFS